MRRYPANNGNSRGGFKNRAKKTNRMNTARPLRGGTRL